ncbi:MAG: HD domain-containing protein [Defluviitaleaceae bacterium]|nr:HD domain-containing protein [Defluviitaleaceae bacterium]MCL2835583.1 HD domain-containing protein [Defluviitaleaceae bacterium]
MLNRDFAERLFEAFTIQRWNDRIRPVELVEMDKHALKAVLTYLIAGSEEKKGRPVDWSFIVNACVFSLLQKIALSDIKSTVTRKIKGDYPETYYELKKWVLDQYQPIIRNKSIMDDFREFLLNADNGREHELRILDAAHKYTTKREFDIIKAANMSFPDIGDIERQLNEGLNEFSDIESMYMLINHSKLYAFVCLIEQLRYQRRWSQTPRIPQTSVLGHSIYAAVLAYFLSRDKEACPKRIVNNFYAALFHDLAESVTRDIISYVKRAAEDLPDKIKAIEKEMCEEELYPKVPGVLLDELKYLLGDVPEIKNEFCNRIIRDEKPEELHKDCQMEINCKYNDDSFNPVDGVLIKICDEIAGFMEARKSIDYGINSKHLQEGCERIKLKLSFDPYGLNIRQFIDSFN